MRARNSDSYDFTLPTLPIARKQLLLHPITIISLWGARELIRFILLSNPLIQPLIYRGKCYARRIT